MVRLGYEIYDYEKYSLLSDHQSFVQPCPTLILELPYCLFSSQTSDKIVAGVGWNSTTSSCSDAERYVLLND